jgi:hypothetical protein
VILTGYSWAGNLCDHLFTTGHFLTEHIEIPGNIDFQEKLTKLMTETNRQGGPAMSDNARRSHTIRSKINTLYPGEPKGNLARHLNTLAGFISGIVGSKSVHLRSILYAIWNRNIFFRSKESWFQPG